MLFSLPRRKPVGHFWIGYAIAWLAVAVVFAFSMAGSGEVPWPAAIRNGLAGAVWAASLGILVRRWGTAKRSLWRSALWHVLLAAGYAGAYAIGILAILFVDIGYSKALHAASVVGGWSFVGGLWMYALLAAAFAAERAQRRWIRERELSLAAEATSARAQLRALQAHLQPHFLFNSLNTIMALIEEDPALAKDGVIRLSGLLRRVLDLDAADQETVRLESECAFTRDYIEIERLRMGERLKVVWNMEPATLPLQVPAFTLQPLVENAVRHGLSPLADGGQIVIESWIAKSGSDEFLKMRVTDTGVGSTAPRGEVSRGFGLHAVRERVLSFGGFRASFEAGNGEERGFCATITLPLQGEV